MKGGAIFGICCNFFFNEPNWFFIQVESLSKEIPEIENAGQSSVGIDSEKQTKYS